MKKSMNLRKLESGLKSMSELKIGLHSAILPKQSYEEVIDICHQKGYRSLEVCVWPQGKSERRYAGVSHLDVDNHDPAYIKHILNYAKANDVELVALGYYPNPLDPDKEKRDTYINHIKKVIQFAHLLGINKVSTFIGKDKTKTVEDNLLIFKDIWTPIISYAESLNVWVGIENCPMYFTKDEWPGGHNLASSPKIWRQMFDLIPSSSFGLSYDPSHLNFQGMDYIKPLIDFKDRIHHVHIKDTLVDLDKLDEVGIFAYPLEFMSPKIPGKGSIDWHAFLKQLKHNHYHEGIVIEIEDRDYEETFDDVLTSLELSLDHVLHSLK